MAETPDHLAPTDGLTNSNLRFAGLDLLPSGEQIVRFEISNEDRQVIAVFPVQVGRTDQGNADRVIADAHAKMRDILRQWLFVTDKMENFYRKQATRP